MEQNLLHPLPPDVVEEPEVMELSEAGGAQVETPHPSSPTVSPDAPTQ